jgi:hypothetical protein
VTTHYGQVLILKTSLTAIVCCMGLLNAATLHPWIATGLGRLQIRVRLLTHMQLNRRMVIEAALIGGILLAAAVLGASQPAHGPQFEPVNTNALVQLPAAALVNDLLVNVNIQPGRAGANFVTLDAVNTRRPTPAPVELVQVELLPPNDGPAIILDAQMSAPERYQIAGVELPVAGEWQAIVTIRRPNMPDSITRMPWQIHPAAARVRPIVISNQPLEPYLNLFAGIAALLSLVAIVLLALRRGGLYQSSWMHQRQVKEHAK